jgi:AcrR family transcriptional regulator
MTRQLLIDREAVITMAMWIADEEGLAAVTMQRVADGLGVTPMALYRHVSNKKDLLDGLVRLLLHDIADPPERMAWRERLRWLAEAVRATALEHPAVFAVLTQQREMREGLHVRLAVVDALREAGVPEDELVRTERVISTVLLGFCASDAGGRFRDLPRREVDGDFAASLRMIEHYVDLVRSEPPGAPGAPEPDLRTG